MTPTRAAGKRKRPKQKTRPRNKAPGLVVEQHPLYPEIIALFRARWTGPSIRARLNKLHHVRFADKHDPLKPLPDSRTLDKYRAANDALLFPHGKGGLLDKELAEPLRAIGDIDLLRSLEGQYQAAEERHARAQEREKADKTGDKLEAVGKTQDTLNEIADRLILVQTRLGFYNPFRASSEAEVARIRGVALSDPKGSKFTEARVNHIITLVDEGQYVDTAANAAGITTPTYYRWKLQGEADLAAGKETEKGEFVLMLTMAMASAEMKAVNLWTAAFVVDWRSVVTWLERTRPERYGRRIDAKIELSRVGDFMSQELGIEGDLAAEYVNRAAAILARGGTAPARQQIEGTGRRVGGPRP